MNARVVVVECGVEGIWPGPSRQSRSMGHLVFPGGGQSGRVKGRKESLRGKKGGERTRG